MSHGIKHGLLVEFIHLGIDNNWTVYKILHPVWPTLHVQGYVPVCPSTDKAVQILQGKRPGHGNSQDQISRIGCIYQKTQSLQNNQFKHNQFVKPFKNLEEKSHIGVSSKL